VKIAITGIGQTTYRRRHADLSSGELMYTAAKRATDDAELALTEIDAFVFGVAPDALSGINCPEKSSFFCPSGRPVIRVNTGGLTGGSALQVAVSLVASGQAEHALALALERMGHATTSQKVFNTIFDPVYEKDISLSTVTMVAIRASMLMQRYGYTTEHWSSVAARNYRNATRNPYAQIRHPYTIEEIESSKLLAWPITLYEGCPMSEGACAVVVSSKPTATPAWIRGLASLSDTYAMGDRMWRPEGVLIDLLTLRRAAAKAYEQAGVDSPGEQLDVVEIHAPFSSAEAMAYPALGLCTSEGGPAFAQTTVDGTSPVQINPSGGPQAANPVSAAALIRVAECAMQVRGSAGETQVPDAHWGVATGQGGANQFSMACVLSSERG
jgi:acetyl-CoA C-acetyltransferase